MFINLINKELELKFKKLLIINITMYIFLKPSQIFCIGGKIVDINFVNNNINSIKYIGLTLQEKNINNMKFKEILRLEKKKKILTKDRIKNSKEIFYINNTINDLNRLWDEIIFFKIIEIQMNNIILEVSSFLLPYNPKSGLKIGDRITANIEFINYLLMNDFNYKTLDVCSCDTTYITDWNGFKYKQNSLDKIINTLDKNCIIRVKLSDIKFSNKSNNFFIKILGFSKTKEWFIGKALQNYKDLDNLNYLNSLNCPNDINIGCLYYFHKNSIIEIPCDNDWQTEEINTKLKNELTNIKLGNESNKNIKNIKNVGFGNIKFI